MRPRSRAESLLEQHDSREQHGVLLVDVEMGVGLELFEPLEQRSVGRIHRLAP